MKTILIWFKDNTGDYRLHQVKVPESKGLEQVAKEFSRELGVRTILEMYTLKATHEVYTNINAEDFIIKTIEH